MLCLDMDCSVKQEVMCAITESVFVSPKCGALSKPPRKDMLQTANDYDTESAQLTSCKKKRAVESIAQTNRSLD